MKTVKKTHGPYLREDGRQHVVVIHTDGSRQTVSYPKFIMEAFLNRKLNPDEQIDHIDGDVLNNNFNNLRVVILGEHQKEDAVRVRKIIVKCMDCGVSIERVFNSIKHNSLKGKAGPFCRSCAGKYGAGIQHRRRSKLPPQVIPIPEYYRRKDK